jgi:CubicO group peptidase (beta-lactamase class C family)/protein-S-isoprenylcysteine O-methyltransferase Ste14
MVTAPGNDDSGWLRSDFVFRHRRWILTALFWLAFVILMGERTTAGSLAEWITAWTGGDATDLASWRQAVLVAGALLVAAGALLRTWASAYLNSAVVHDVDLHAERLVADGPYRQVRNPLYLGLILIAAGAGVLASPTGWLVLLAGELLISWLLIRREETALLRSQGAGYRRYLARVPRLWPALSPRLPAGGGQPSWKDGFAGEMLFWGWAIAFLIYALTGATTPAFAILALGIVASTFQRSAGRRRLATEAALTSAGSVGTVASKRGTGAVARRLGRTVVRTLVMVAAVLFAPWTGFRPDRVFHIVTGLTSKTICSQVFVAGLDPRRVFDEDLAPRPGVSLIAWALRTDVDREHREVRATLAGAFGSRSIYRPGLGCLLVLGDPPPAAAGSTAAPAPGADLVMPSMAGPAVVEPADARLRLALDQAFAEPDRPPRRQTRAVVVVHDGKVIAERYAPGIGVATPMFGYSATKSVIQALVGILVRQGRLDVTRPAPVAAWSGAGDPRRAITLDQLLRMASGLALEESDRASAPVSRMMFDERDMAGFAERAPLAAKPGTVWAYTSGNTQIVSRLLRDAVGGDGPSVLAFARRELFAPLGMDHVTLELDATGTPVGSTDMLAPAREWARFGMLYLNDGMLDGRRILPAGWVRYGAAPTLQSPYGAGFWTESEDAVWRVRHGLPADSFYAAGLLGQYVVVMPADHLIVARFGASMRPGGTEMRGLAQFVSAVRATLPR